MPNVNDMSKPLIENLRYWLYIKNWTLSDLAKQSGVSVHWISDLMNGRTGRNPSYITIYKLAETLEIRTEDLLNLKRL